MMKMKHALSFLCALVISLNSFAQTSSKSISFGIKAGATLATSRASSDEESATSGAVFRITGGAFVAFPLSSNFSIQTELAYAGLGAKGKDDASSQKLPIDYLVLPVLAKYTFGESGFSLYSGPQIGLLLSAKLKEGGVSVAYKEYFKSTDIAGVFGLEYAIPETQFLVSARYQQGVTNIVKNAYRDLVGTWKNQAGSLTIGYRFK